MKEQIIMEIVDPSTAATRCAIFIDIKCLGDKAGKVGSSMRTHFVYLMGATNLPNLAIGHEHKMVMQFQDKDHITEHWTWRRDGRDSETVYKFVRQSNR